MSKTVVLAVYRGLLREAASFAPEASSHGRCLSDELRTLQKCLCPEQYAQQDNAGALRRTRLLQCISSASEVPSTASRLLDRPFLRTVIRHCFDSHRRICATDAEELIGDAFAVLRFVAWRRTALSLVARSTKSEALCGSCRVSVSSFPIPEKSHPSQSYYAFGYRVRVANESAHDTLQLVDRHWDICDEDGLVLDCVDGPGVVGQCPILPPGSCFEYSGACPLNLEVGAMSGHFGMLNLTDMTEFRAKIAPFVLSVYRGSPDDVFDDDFSDGTGQCGKKVPGKTIQ